MPPVLHLDGRDVMAELSARGGDALVVLGTEACGACRRAKRVLGELEDGEVGGPGLLVAHVDALHAAGLLEEWEIHHLPGLILIRGGDPWVRVESRLVASELGPAIASARRGPPDPEL